MKLQKQQQQELIPGLPEEIARECLVRLPYNCFLAATAVCNRWKEELHSADFHLLRKASGSARSLLVLSQSLPSRTLGAVKHPAGPAYQLSVFDPGFGSWIRLPPLPDLPDGIPLFSEIAGAGRSLVLLGGWNPVTWDVSNDVHVYDFVSARWKRGASMPGPRRSFFACASDGESTVLVAGGHDEEKSALTSALAYHVARDEWVPLPDMANERDECKGIFRRGGFHVIGGYRTDRQGGFEKSGERFDLATWQWGPLGDVLDSDTCPRTCVASDSGEMYRCSGSGGELKVRRGAEWHVAAKFPADARVGTYMVAWQSKLLVIGTERHGGPYVGYMLESRDEKYTWTAVEAPKEYVGYVQSACRVEI